MDDATWSTTNTGTVFHSFNGTTAICRTNIIAARSKRTEAEVDKALAEPWGIGTQGYRKCDSCAKKEAAFRDRLAASMEPSTGEGDHLPPAGITSEVETAPVAKTHHYNALGGQRFIQGRGWVNHCRVCQEPEGSGDHFYNKETEVTYHGRRTTGPLNQVQIHILKLLAEGHEHKEVANRIGQTRVSVSENVRTAAMKMGVSTSTAAVATYARVQAYYNASNQVARVLLPNPLGEAEEHVNHALEGIAAELRATGDRLLPQ